MDLVEFEGTDAIDVDHGLAVLADRDQALAASRRGLALADRDSLPPCGGAVVHHVRSRTAVIADLTLAWNQLPKGGRLELVGGNREGVRGTARQWQARCGVIGETVAVGGHQRVYRFHRQAGPIDRLESPPLALDHGLVLMTRPGAYGTEGVDAGSRLVLERLAGPAPRRLLDLACGLGVLGFTALQRWPEASGLLLDSDARSIAACRETIARCGWGCRAEARWWSVSETVGDNGFDLVLANPPWHRGRTIDWSVLAAFLGHLPRVLAPGGRALVVTARTAPLERRLPEGLALIGSESVGSFKVCELVVA